MKVQSIFPFIIFHVEKDEEITMEKCIATLKSFKKQYKEKGLSKKSLRNAIEYYEKLIKEEK